MHCYPHQHRDLVRIIVRECYASFLAAREALPQRVSVRRPIAWSIAHRLRLAELSSGTCLYLHHLSA